MTSLANKDVDKSTLANAVVGTSDKIITADILVQAAIIKFKAADPLPTSDIGAIWHDDYASVMTFRTIGSYTGYASVEIGKVVMVDSTVAPAGYIAYDGATLSGSKYAALIAARGNATLIDGRGEFFRAADNGRGVDSGRTVGSWQKGTLTNSDDGNGIQTISFGAYNHYDVYGADKITLQDADSIYPNRLISDVNAAIATGYYNNNPAYYGVSRPRNIALLACIKY